MKHNWIFNKVIQGKQLPELCKYLVLILFSLIDKTVHNSALIIVIADIFSCPGRMIANSIPARLVATRMRVALPRACACHCHTHAHGHTVRACTRPYHAHAHGYHMHRAEL